MFKINLRIKKSKVEETNSPSGIKWYVSSLTNWFYETLIADEI